MIGTLLQIPRLVSPRRQRRALESRALCPRILGGLSLLIVSLASALSLEAQDTGSSTNTAPLPLPFASLPGTTNEASAPKPVRAIESVLSSGWEGLSNRIPASTVQRMDLLDNKQKLAIGDRVIYRVIEDQDDPKPLTIGDAGDLDVPYVGLVRAQDKTCKGLAEEIKVLLEKDYYKRATVIIGIDLLNKTTTGRKVYVVGQVRLTGPQEFPAGEPYTVSKAILRAGGFSDFADKKHVRIVRTSGDTKKTFEVNVIAIWEKGKTETDVTLEPEDLVYVPARAINF
jgi:protein involved in polysaccharide export with SLBB domain